MREYADLIQMAVLGVMGLVVIYTIIYNHHHNSKKTLDRKNDLR